MFKFRLFGFYYQLVDIVVNTITREEGINFFVQGFPKIKNFGRVVVKRKRWSFSEGHFIEKGYETCIAQLPMMSLQSI